MPFPSVNNCQEETLTEILDDIGHITKRNKTFQSLQNQVSLALENNALASKLPPLPITTDITEEYLRVIEPVKFLRSIEFTEQRINSLLKSGLTADDIKNPSKERIMDLNVSNAIIKDLITIFANTIPNFDQRHSIQQTPTTAYQNIQLNRNDNDDHDNRSEDEQRALPELSRRLSFQRNNSHPNQPFNIDNSQFYKQYKYTPSGLTWSEVRPKNYTDNMDFASWADDLEWCLERADPGGVTWVVRTEQLLSGRARNESQLCVYEGLSGREYLKKLRSRMLSGNRLNSAFLDLVSQKWSTDSNCDEFYAKIKKFVNMLRPGIDSICPMLVCLYAIPVELAVKIVNDGGLKSESKFQTVFSNRAWMSSQRKKPSNSSSNSNSNSNTNRPNRQNNNRNNPNNNSNSSQRNNLPNNQSNNNRSNMNRNYNYNNNQNRNPNSNYNRNNNNNNRYQRGNNNQRNQNNNRTNQVPLPGTSNSTLPSTPQLNAGYIPPPSQPTSANPCPSQPNPIPMIPNTWVNGNEQQNLSLSIEYPFKPVFNVNHANYLHKHHQPIPMYNYFPYYFYHQAHQLHAFPAHSTAMAGPHASNHQNQTVPYFTQGQMLSMNKRADLDSTILAACVDKVIDKTHVSGHQIHAQVNSKLSKIRGPLPELIIEFFKHPEIKLKCLIDTGSAISIIPASVADDLGLMSIPCSARISGINGSNESLSPRGLTYLRVKLSPDAVTYTQPFYVVTNILEPIMLGRDFLRNAELNIQCAKDGFSIRHYTGLIPDPMRPVETLVIGAHLPSREEFAQVVAEFQQTQLAPSITPSMNITCFKAKCDPISDVPVNFDERLASRISTKLPRHEREMLWSSIYPFFDVFSRSKYDLGRVPFNVCNVKINIGDKPVPSCLPNRYSPVRKEQLERVISELKACDIVEDSSASGGAPALLVAKKDGSLRLVVSYIELNKITERRCYPVPNIDDFIASVQGYKYFAILDLAQGYYQIEIPPLEREKTAFVTQVGKYQYKRLPMGLADSPAYFQELMNRVIGDLRKDTAQVYFDDILVKGRTIEELSANLTKVFERLRQFNLKLKYEKCLIGVTELVYLGHLISGRTIKPDPEKIRALQAVPFPKTLKQLQSLLGMFNHYSRYVPNFSKIVAPLYRLTSKARKFKLDKSDHQIVNSIKNTLAQDCMLAIYNPNLPVRLLVDASGVAVAGILEQQEKEGWRAVHYFSQKLNQAQKNYTITEKECLAVILVVGKFKHFLEGKHFTIVSDHHALCSLAKTPFKLERLNRWATVLSQFDYKIVYSKGVHHPADCFTRANDWNHRSTVDVDEEELICLTANSIAMADPFCNYSPPEVRLSSAIYLTNLIENSYHKKFSDHTFIDETWKHCQVLHTVSNVPFDRKELSLQQRNDIFCRDIINDLQSKVDSHFSNKFEFVNGLLFRKAMKNRSTARIVLPLSFKDAIIDYYHSEPSGLHFSTNKTYEIIAQYFWCKDLKDWIKTRIEACNRCNSSKKGSNVGYIPSSMPIAEMPMERVQIDIVGKLPLSDQGNEYIITAIDMHSGFMWAKAQKRTTSVEIIKFIEDIKKSFGLPKYLHSDNGKNFVSHQFQNFLASLGIKHVRSTFYHPQSQGRVERFNGTLSERLRTMNLKKHWDRELDNILHQLNITPNGANSPSPFYLIHGYNPRTAVNNVLDINPPSDQNISDERQKANQLRDLNQHKTLSLRMKKLVMPKIKHGDIVKIKIIANNRKSGKLAEKFSLNNYVVVRINHNSTAKIVDTKTGQERTENFARLKRCRGRKPLNYHEIVEKYKEVKQEPPVNQSAQ